MQEYTISIVCEDGHSQTVHIVGMTREKALLWCGLVDGSSPAYLSDPRQDRHSLIGHCGVCGKVITATIKGEGDQSGG